MATKISSEPLENPTYGAILKEVVQSAKDLVASEIRLMTTEIKFVAQRLSKHSALTAIFGGLLAISVFPFLAFCVIGLGDLLDGRYWLSSLTVAVICAAVGGVMAYRTYQKIKEEDLGLPYTKSSLSREAQIVQEHVSEIKNAVRGEHHETNHVHH